MQKKSEVFANIRFAVKNDEEKLYKILGRKYLRNNISAKAAYLEDSLIKGISDAIKMQLNKRKEEAALENTKPSPNLGEEINKNSNPNQITKS